MFGSPRPSAGEGLGGGVGGEGEYLIRFEELYRRSSFKRASSNCAMYSRIFFANSVGDFSTMPFGKRTTRYPLFSNSRSGTVEFNDQFQR